MPQVFGLDFTQADVDFVVPDLAGDLRLGIDPFLLFKSRDPEYRAAHERLLWVFNDAIQRYARDEEDAASRLLDFPEVNEIGMGYRVRSAHGSGLGTYLNTLLLRTLGESRALVARGVRHVEEMQLVSLGINADRISDIAGNLLKGFLVQYTQRQCERYGIMLTRGVPVPHLFDYEDWDWRDDYYDLPVNPLDPKRRAIILVPRRIVRSLPWINFSDYERLEFGLFLRAKRTPRAVKNGATAQGGLTKEDVVAVTRREVQRIDHYVDVKERDARTAEPERLVTPADIQEECERLIAELQSLPTGRAEAYRYQELMFRVLNVLFGPDLIEGRKQARSEHGTEIRDLLYTNDSDKPFWDFIRNRHGGLTVVFECKNTDEPDGRDIDQLAGYLGDALGYFGVIVCRKPLTAERRVKCIAWYNKGAPHRVVVAVADEDVVRMLQMKACGKDASEIVRYRYQDLMARVQ